MRNGIDRALGTTCLLLLSGCSAALDERGASPDETVAATSDPVVIAQGAAIANGGDWHTCALLEGGHVKCWGSNFWGQLGQGDNYDRGGRPYQLHDNLPPVRLGTGRTAKALVAGGGESCVILDNDQLKCWGNLTSTFTTDNIKGRVAGDMGDNLPYILLGTGRKVKAFSSNNQTRCALLDNNQIRCWGNNQYGRVGIGTTATVNLETTGPDNVPTVNLGTGRSAKAVSVGPSHACAILDTDQIKCWGRNHQGQLGLGDTNDRGDQPGEMGDALPIVSLGTSRTAKAVSVGEHDTCVLLDNNQMKCWGDNGSGQLGLGDTLDRGDGPGEMGNALPPIAVGNGVTVKAMGTAGGHTCALMSNDQVKCWGYGWYGELGQGDQVSRGDDPLELLSTPAIALGTGRTVRTLAVGQTTVCAVLDNGALKCWGMNQYGALGLGDTNVRGDGPGEMGNALPAVALGTPSGGLAYAGVVNGSFHSCSIRSNNGVKCWGQNTHGQLGIGNTSDQGDGWGEVANLPLLSLGTGRSAVKLALGDWHSCALLDNAKVKCWGRNHFGQLGVGHTSSRGGTSADMGDALEVASLGISRLATEIDAGGNHTCAMLGNNEVKCWGLNTSGQLGLGDTVNRGDGPSEMGNALPAVSLGGALPRSLSAGGDHTCVTVGTGNVKCWGSNSFGELGQGDTQPRGGAAGQMGTSLASVSLGTDVHAWLVSAGTTHTCVRTSEGRVKCWGRNNYGQLGLGDTQNRGDQPGEMGDSLPFVDLGVGRTAKSVAAGHEFTCAWLDNDQVKCWGKNDWGMLGLGDTAHRGNAPGEMGDALPAVSLGTGYSARSLSVGFEHTCLRAHLGTYKCWGRADYGKLGLGDEEDRGDEAGEMGNSLPELQLLAP